MFVQAKTKKIQIGTFFGCNSGSVQPLTVHSHQLLCVKPNYSGTHNTAKSCTEYSHYICSVVQIVTSSNPKGKQKAIFLAALNFKNPFKNFLMKGF